MKIRHLVTLGAGVFALLFSGVAAAHVDVVGPAVAGANEIVKFTVGHGCEGADTVSVEIRIPSEITSLRALRGSFQNVVATRSSSTAPITSVTWSKPDATDSDFMYYEMALRMRLPNTPFATLYFEAIQTCRTPGGEIRVSEWVARPGEEGEPAAPLVLVPAKRKGWNKYTVSSAIEDLSIFDDAEIVWAGEAAYSANATIKDLIANEAGVGELTAIAANTEIWVKY